MSFWPSDRRAVVKAKSTANCSPHYFFFFHKMCSHSFRGTLQSFAKDNATMISTVPIKLKEARNEATRDVFNSSV